jgi:four helix bundle protein
MAQDFGDLVVWREASALAAAIHDNAASIKGHARSSAISQMVRAAESIPANLVEGIGRGVSRDCVRFLTIARSSAVELEHHLRQARLSGRMTPPVVDALISHNRRVRFLLRRFQDSVRRRLDP